MKNNQFSYYRPKFVELLLQENESPPDLMEIVPEVEKSSLSLKKQQQESQYSQLIKQKLEYEEMQRNTIKKYMSEIENYQYQIEQLQQKLKLMANYQRKCEEYEIIIDNLNKKQKEMDLKNKDLENKLKKLVEQFKKENQELKLNTSSNLSMETSIMNAQKEIKREVFQSIESYTKKVISDFLDNIKHERMNKKLEEKIECFLEELLQINTFIINNNKSKRTPIIQTGRLLKTTERTTERFDDEKKNYKNENSGKLNRTNISYIESSRSKTQEEMITQTKFNLIRYGVEPIAAEESILLNVSNIKKQEQKPKEVIHDRDRSKSQRRRKIFQ